MDFVQTDFSNIQAHHRKLCLSAPLAGEGKNLFLCQFRVKLTQSVSQDRLQAKGAVAVSVLFSLEKLWGDPVIPSSRETWRETIHEGLD